jgi:mitochondrial import inner membrane translocase subunit TIM23
MAIDSDSLVLLALVMRWSKHNKAVLNDVGQELSQRYNDLVVIFSFSSRYRFLSRKPSKANCKFQISQSALCRQRPGRSAPLPAPRPTPEIHRSPSTFTRHPRPHISTLPATTATAAAMLMATTLRPARAFTVQFKPASVFACCSPSATFTTSTRPSKDARTSSTTPSITSLSRPFRKLSVRTASTATPTTSTNPPPPSSQPPTTLTWNRFLELRRKRRKISVIASSFTAVATCYGGLRVFIEQNLDAKLSAMVGLDPIIVTGMGVIGLLATGWLIGPAFGNAVFNGWYSKIRPEIELVSLPTL